MQNSSNLSFSIYVEGESDNKSKLSLKPAKYQISGELSQEFFYSDHPNLLYNKSLIIYLLKNKINMHLKFWIISTTKWRNKEQNRPPITIVFIPSLPLPCPHPYNGLNHLHPPPHHHSHLPHQVGSLYGLTQILFNKIKTIKSFPFSFLVWQVYKLNIFW